MGQKTHPTGFRLGGVLDWQSQIGGEKPRNTNPLNIKFPSESA